MRLAQFSIFLFITYLTIGILTQTLAANLTSDGISTGNMLFDILLQPWNWSNQTFWTVIAGFGVVTAGIVVGTLLVSKSDLGTLAPLAATFFMVGAYMMTNIYWFILNGVISLIPSCSFNQTCYEANLIAGLIGGVVGIMYFYSVLEWWAWRQTSVH